jgi:O-acetyl-ADP-ribose deacetylase (regulator of RNase III)
MNNTVGKRIKYVNADILSVTNGILAHGCNSRGIMGAGVAKAIKDRYPEVYRNYFDIHRTSGLRLGDALPVKVNDNLTVWNLITQSDFGGLGTRWVNYSALVMSVLCMLNDVPKNAVICIPKIGAGLGGGDWDYITELLIDSIDLSGRDDVSFCVYYI